MQKRIRAQEMSLQLFLDIDNGIEMSEILSLVLNWDKDAVPSYRFFF